MADTVTRWLTRSRERYPDSDSLLYALATYAVANSPRPVTATHLHRQTRIVLGDQAPSLNRVRRALDATTRHQVEHGTWTTPSTLAGGRVVSVWLIIFALAVSAYPSIPQRRLALARRAAIIIGLHHHDEAADFARVIVSARWLAVQLASSIAQAAVVIDDLNAAGVLRHEKKLRDGRTRSFKLRPPHHARTEWAQLLFGDEVARLAAGEQPAPGSLGDVILAAASPYWQLGDVPHRGAYATALADAARPRLAEWRAAVAALPAADFPNRPAMLAEVNRLVADLHPGAHGGPAAGRQKPLRDWLASRPADTGLAVWLGGLPGAADVAERHTALRAAAARDRRARRAAADAAVGGRRRWLNPEEWAAGFLQAAGNPPTGVEQVEVWLVKLRGGWLKLAGTQRTLARATAVKQGVAVLLTRAGVSEELAAQAAEKVVAVPADKA